jgi:histidinol-phosphate aminotransferase
MPISRRGFLRGLGAGSAGLVLSPSLGARELHASLSGLAPFSRVAGPIQLDRNENPFGPGRHVLEAIQAAFGEASRYPDDPEEALRKAIAARHGVTPESVLLGCGSTETLRVAVMAFCRADRHLVTAAPTFEECAPGGVGGCAGGRIQARTRARVADSNVGAGHGCCGLVGRGSRDARCREHRHEALRHPGG